MMSEGNNGYIMSAVMAEQGDLLPTESRECSPAEASLQVSKEVELHTVFFIIGDRINVLFIVEST